MGKNKYYCKIDDTIYNFKDVEELILQHRDWDAIEQIVKIIGCDYGVAGNIFMQIKENNNTIPMYINSKQQSQQKNIPKCPTCSSPNIKKISTTSKAINTALFGVFGNKRKKQFHCNNCGYEW